jgi:hypothetical protein
MVTRFTRFEWFKGFMRVRRLVGLRVQLDSAEDRVLKSAPNEPFKRSEPPEPMNLVNHFR